MEFNLNIKEKEVYKKIKIIPPANSDWHFFKSLKLTIEQQIEVIRGDIASFFEDDEEANLKRPIINNKELQEKLNTLVEMRKENIKTKHEVTMLLNQEEFIICEKCSGKMYKTPIGVSYEKYGTKYLLKDVNAHENIKYVFMCESCISAVGEDIYIQEQNNLKLRKQLIDAGESFVPNAQGFWHWINYDKKTKPDFMQDPELEPRRRSFEYINIAGVKNAFVKIVEHFPLSNRKESLK